MRLLTLDPEVFCAELGSQRVVVGQLLAHLQFMVTQHNYCFRGSIPLLDSMFKKRKNRTSPDQWFNPRIVCCRLICLYYQSLVSSLRHATQREEKLREI
jgi:hypothetical protein